MMKRWRSLYSIWAGILLFVSYGLVWWSDGFDYSTTWFPLAGGGLLVYGGYRLHRTKKETEEPLTDGVQTYFKATVGILLIAYTVFSVIFAVTVLY
jgi:hypothetical protein